MPIKARLFLWVIVVAGGLAAFWGFPSIDFIRGRLPVILVLFVFSFLAEVYEIEILPKHGISVSTGIYASAIYIGGFPLAVSVALPAALLSELFIRGLDLFEGGSVVFPLRKLAFNVAQFILSIGVSAYVFDLVEGGPPPFVEPYDYLPPFVAFLALVVVNTSLVSGIVSLAEGESFLYQLKFSLRNLHLQVLSLGVLSVLIAVTYASSPWNLGLVVVLLFLVNTSLRNYITLRKQAKQTFERIMDLLEKRDHYTHHHSESVGELTRKIADRLRVGPEEKEDIVSAARVHDIGKLGIPDSILLKKGDLDDEEWETMKEHPVIGADILSELKIYEDAAEVVKYEHERWDGSGYPEGLSGEEIPLGSRIVAVADVWNALRTERPYRGPLSSEQAREEIKDMAGKTLDPEVVEALLDVLDTEGHKRGGGE